MQSFLDIKGHLTNLETLIFNESDLKIQENLQVLKGESLIYLGGIHCLPPHFYETLDLKGLKKSHISMFSSGTTQKSKSLYLRSKQSVVEEILEVELLLPFLRSKKILVMVTPNHSFGLIPALLTSRKCSKEVYLSTASPIEALSHLFQVMPEVIFTVPLHLRLLADWGEKKGKDLSFLKNIVYAGASLDQKLISFFNKLNIPLTSVYGTTQTGVISIQKKVKKEDPNNCGKVLKNLTVFLSKEQKEIIVLTPDRNPFHTGDRGTWIYQDLIVQGRIDSIVFYHGNKIDLRWLENLIQEKLTIETVKVCFEKNINGQSEIICYLPKKQESHHLNLLEKIKKSIPAYAIPKRFYYV